MKRSFVIVTTIVTALLTIATAQAETGGAGGMHKIAPSAGRDPAGHHRLQGSSLHENAANYHKVAAKYHKVAAAKYRRAKDDVAVKNALAAISASEDASRATEASKAILPK